VCKGPLLLFKFLVEEGTTGIPVGSPIAIVVENKEDIAKYADYVPPSVSEASSSPSEPIAAPSKSNYPRHEVLGLPALSPNMEAGKIASWTKRVGDRISTGESIADIETDKATVPFEATDDYYIAKILVQPGTVVPVGHPIAVVVEDKADIDKFADFSLDDVANRGSPSKAAPQPSAAPSPLPSSRPASLPSASAGSSDRVLASPKAKVAAKEKGIDLSQVRGTGPNGRIIFADVEEFVPAPKVIIF
jgi:pyruvate dehydrogenase E2 component (dihydrolipoamide acetyltransferase)